MLFSARWLIGARTNRLLLQSSLEVARCVLQFFKLRSSQVDGPLVQPLLEVSRSLFELFEAAPSLSGSNLWRTTLLRFQLIGEVVFLLEVSYKVLLGL